MHRNTYETMKDRAKHIKRNCKKRKNKGNEKEDQKRKEQEKCRKYVYYSIITSCDHPIRSHEEQGHAIAKDYFFC